jgi:dTDP-4-amino-4,6-dideoxygalactose transaminase
LHQGKLQQVQKNIPFNKVYLTGRETEYISQCLSSGKIGGNGAFTRKCETFFEKRYGFKKALLTTSCTTALELCTILLDIRPGDEIIIPSYTYVSSANPFVLAGATIVFADSEPGSPNIDPSGLEVLITAKTRAIVAVHYAGVACDLNAISSLCKKHKLLLIEDAAHAIDAFYFDLPLGSIGDMAVFSFHETKNITSGEGGLLVINNEKFLKRAEVVREKGTNREAFLRHEVEKYEWVDTGSSFLPSDYTAAFLWAQLEELDKIQEKRKGLWMHYYEALKPVASKGYFHLPCIPSFTGHNAHIFYLRCRNAEERQALNNTLAAENISAAFHYQALHSSPYYKGRHDGRILAYAEMFTGTLLRLPLFNDLELNDVDYICEVISNHYSDAARLNQNS